MTSRKNMRKFVLVVAFTAAFAGTALADDSRFVQGTTVNGLGVSGMSVEEANAHIKTFYSGQYELTIKEKGGKKEVLKGSDIGYQVELPEGLLQKILEDQNAGGRVSGPAANTKYSADMANTYNAETAAAKINALNCLSGSDIVITADAHVTEYREDKPFEIVEAVYGNNVNRELTESLIKNALASGAREIDLVNAGCYYSPTITADNAELKDLCASMNRCRSMSVTYVFGKTPAAEEGQEPQKITEVLDAARICSWLQGTRDGQIQVNRSLMAAYVAELAGKYDTAGRARNFIAADGRTTSVSGGYYGWKINQAAEIDALTEIIRTGQSQEREPVYASRAVDHSAQEWGNTYIEIDLTNQHVYMKKDGQIVWDAPCVTGNVSKGTITPEGVYSLNYKERDRVLRGTKRADGTYPYESPVSYWMPFNGGIGLHDANWRSSFGGSIYQSSGSHGCVNLPPSKAGALYEMVYTGIPVICYK